LALWKALNRILCHPYCSEMLLDLDFDSHYHSNKNNPLASSDTKCNHT
jgi:hypothetical protein